MAQRSFGWIQDSGSIASLKNVLRAIVPTTDFNKLLREKKIPSFIPARFGRDELINAITGTNCNNISYTDLKGKGTSCQLTATENENMFGYSATEASKMVVKGGRPNTACTGIVQISLIAQKNLPNGLKKPYQGDWQADCFLRWAISIGLMNYDSQKDTCCISKRGLDFVNTADNSDAEKDIVGEALLSYPPVGRVLSLLEQNGHMTKFEIGKQLGFIGEAGFTSIPQNMYAQGYCSATTRVERTEIRQNTEGSSDKYARMIAGWLIEIGWIAKSTKTVSEIFAGMTYTTEIGQAYVLTLSGRKALNRVKGKSSVTGVDKIVFWDMLATKAPDANYLRNRRAYTIQALSNDKTLDDIVSFLKTKGIDEDTVTIEDDIKSFECIGLNILKSGNKYRITDNIINLQLPTAFKSVTKSSVSVVKDIVRKALKTINHKYLILLDLAYDSVNNRDFEIETMSLLTDELNYKGTHLGGVSKPDGVFYYNNNGVIVDTKAYSKGYSLPLKQADEMIRYVEENKTRGTINPNKWWKNFDTAVNDFSYLFVSSEFTGGFQDRIDYIKKRTSYDGAVITAENLLYFAESVNSGKYTYTDSFNVLKVNTEVVI